MFSIRHGSMRVLAAAAAGAVVAAAAGTAGAQTTVYDADADFVAFENANSGPAVPPVNGVWSYGTSGTVGGTFTGYVVHGDSLFNASGAIQGFQETDDGVPALAVNVSSAPDSPCCGITPVDPGQIFLHPDPAGQPDTYSVLRFTAPSEGSFTVTANFEQLHASPATTFLAVNGVQTDNATGTSTLTESGNLLAGQTIDIVVGPQTSGDYGSTSTGLFATVGFTPIPEPASLGLLGLGALGLLARRRSR